MFAKILNFTDESQIIKMPLETPVQAQMVLNLLCSKGAKGRLAFTDLEFLTDGAVRAANASHFAQGHFAVGSAPFVSNGNKLLELLNWAWQRRVLRDGSDGGDSEEESSGGSSHDSFALWERPD